MKSREVYSLLASFVAAIVIFAIIGWLLWDAAGGKASGAEPAKLDDGPVVMLVLDVPLQPVAPGQTSDAGEAASLATSIVGNSDRPQPATEAHEPEQQPSREAKPSPSDVTENSKSESDAAVTVGAEIPNKPSEAVPASEQRTVSPAPSTAGDGQQSQLTLKGKMPPLVHVGDTSALREKFPRLEVVWVLDRSPSENDATDRVHWEFVMDASGQICWQNLRTDDGSPTYSLATMRHNTNERIHAADPSQLKLWAHREEILRLTELPSDSSPRLLWGYYRHRAEVARLAPVGAAFQRALETGHLQFDPARRDRLELQWQLDEPGEPHVAHARFVPEEGPIVDLDLK